MKVSILVVLYSCEIYRSKTIQTLISSGVEGGRLVVWNNGPRVLKEWDVTALKSSGFDDVVVIETIDNIALSKIYNDFMVRWSADRYVFLDHDSTLNTGYLEEIFCDAPINIGVPLIEVLGEVRSPTIKGGFREGPYFDRDQFVAIGSGLILGAKAVRLLEDRFTKVFDERFYLYGVDTVFFFRIRIAGMSNLIKVIGGFEHSLSRLEEESLAVKKFRKIERSYDIGLSARYYFTQSKLLLIKALIKRCLGFDTYSLRSILKAAVIGRHYRDKK